MSDGEVDIRLLALRRQQNRNKSKSNTGDHHATVSDTYNGVRSGRSAYEATPIKAYNGGTPEPLQNGALRRNSSSYLSTLPAPLFDDDIRIGRMHVPPVIRCECNGVEAYALISTSETVSTMSLEFVRKLRLLDQVIPEPSNVYNPLALYHPELKGKVKYIDFSIGSLQQVAQFNVVDSNVSDVILGIDFLRRTQSVVNFQESCFMVGGNKGERIPLLNTREIMSLAKRSVPKATPLIMTNGFAEHE